MYVCMYTSTYKMHTNRHLFFLLFGAWYPGILCRVDGIKICAARTKTTKRKKKSFTPYTSVPSTPSCQAADVAKRREVVLHRII